MAWKEEQAYRSYTNPRRSCYWNPEMAWSVWNFPPLPPATHRSFLIPLSEMCLRSTLFAPIWISFGAPLLISLSVISGKGLLLFLIRFQFHIFRVSYIICYATKNASSFRLMLTLWYLIWFAYLCYIGVFILQVSSVALVWRNFFIYWCLRSL